MLGYVVRRLLATVPVLLAVAVVTFFLMYRAPGGPYRAGVRSWAWCSTPGPPA